MSIWVCCRCGKTTGGSTGSPRCASCGSLNVERLELASESSEPHVVSEPLNPLESYRRMQKIEGELFELRQKYDDACAVLRAPDTTNDGGPADLAEDIRTLLHNQAVELEAFEDLRQMCNEVIDQRDAARAEAARFSCSQCGWHHAVDCLHKATLDTLRSDHDADLVEDAALAERAQAICHKLGLAVDAEREGWVGRALRELESRG
jgi:hypothetical protein